MSKHTFGQWVFALRPWSIPASAMPIIVTLAYLFFKGSEINWLYGVWSLIGMILFHIKIHKFLSSGFHKGNKYFLLST